jgi:hypothetical protein
MLFKWILVVAVLVDEFSLIIFCFKMASELDCLSLLFSCFFIIV